jgi:hypothetical protein
MSLRTFTNKPGATYDAAKTAVLYAEDINYIGETLAGLGTPPVKATGAELNTGTDDAKFATAKALADSDYAKTTDIPTVPVKASGSEIDTGTDDAKFATAKAIADSGLTTTTELNTRTSYKKGASVLTDGATPALDASLGDIFTLSAGGNRTIAVPSNPVSGQKITIRHYASAGARTLALNTGANGFRFGSDITALTETASGKTDYVGAIWNSTDSKWDVVAYIKGF